MATVPIQTVFRGDFVVQLVPVDDEDTMETVAQKVAHHVIDRRLPSKEAPMRVSYSGQVLSSEQTVGEAGIQPMDYVEVFFADE